MEVKTALQEDGMGNIHFTVCKDIGCVHFKGEGDISFAYLLENIRKVQQHPDFEYSFNTFIDFEDAAVSLEREGLDAYNDFFTGLQASPVKRKWAIYSRNFDTLKNANMAHLFEAETISVDVFEVKREALNYLGITEEDLRRCV